MGTLPDWWTNPYPEVSSVQAATAYLDELGAAISRRQEDGGWTLATGDQDLITADDERELDGFVLGFALAHLIVERHGPIGRRVPHPAEQQQAPPDVSEGQEAEGAEDAGSGGEGDPVSPTT